MTEEVIYLEVDEDITSAIDKLTKAKSGQLTIVAPKRSTLIQSLINLKLLQKAAADAGKNIVLVTGDRTATHMAGRLGLAVAATLKGKPTVPRAPEVQPNDATEVIEDSDEETDATDAEQATGSPVATVPIAGPKVSRRSLVAPAVSAVATSAVVSDDLVPAAAFGLASAKEASTKSAPLKVPRVPNFQSMQQKVVLAAFIVAAVVVLIGINMYIAKANVTLFAKGTEVDTHFKFTLDPTARTSDIAKSTIIAQSLTASHVLTAPVTATGKKDVGTKAVGQMTISNAYDAAPHTLPAGTKFSSSSKIFTSDSDVTVPGATAVIQQGQVKLVPGKSNPVSVTASEFGDSYNLGPASYAVSGQPAQISAQGGQMSGGTSKQVDVITQADIDAAKKSSLDKDKDSGLKELQAKVATNYTALENTFAQLPAEAAVSPAVNAEASTATATIKVDYSLLAYNKPDLAALVQREQEKQVGENSQIYDDGAVDAKITGPAVAGGAWLMNYQTTAYAGTKLDKLKIAKSLSGKRYGDAADIAQKLPGVEKVEISLWPSWTSSIPRFLNHITIDIKIAPRR